MIENNSLESPLESLRCGEIRKLNIVIENTYGVSADDVLIFNNVTRVYLGVSHSMLRYSLMSERSGKRRVDVNDNVLSNGMTLLLS